MITNIIKEDSEESKEDKTEQVLSAQPAKTKKSNIVIDDNVKAITTAIKTESKKKKQNAFTLISNMLYTLILIGYDSGYNNVVLTNKANFASELQNLCAGHLYFFSQGRRKDRPLDYVPIGSTYQLWHIIK